MKKFKKSTKNSQPSSRNIICAGSLIFCLAILMGCSSQLYQSDCQGGYYEYTLTNNIGCDTDWDGATFSAAIGYYDANGIFLHISNVDLSCSTKSATAFISQTNAALPNTLTIRIKDTSKKCFSNVIISEFLTDACEDSYSFKLNRTASGTAFIKGSSMN